MKPTGKKRSTASAAGKPGTAALQSVPEDGSGTYNRIFGVVRRIPRGRVATYGQIADLAGFPGQARLTGYALHTLKEGTDVPWYRVVNASGRISFPAGSEAEAIQRALLKSENVRFNANGTIPMDHFQWQRSKRGF